MVLLILATASLGVGPIVELFARPEMPWRLAVKFKRSKPPFLLESCIRFLKIISDESLTVVVAALEPRLPTSCDL